MGKAIIKIHNKNLKPATKSDCHFKERQFKQIGHLFI